VTLLKRLFNLFKRKSSQKKSKSAPLLIIKKDAEDANIKEYNSIEAAIADLENDPNVPAEKIEKLKASFKMLKDKTSIKIRNGELVK
jgi:hypothetical protein